MQEIVDKYDTGDTSYLLPVIKNDGRDERTQYVSSEHCVNRNLKKIGKMLGLDIPLTTYVARHGWASIAKSKNIPLSIISEKPMRNQIPKSADLQFCRQCGHVSPGDPQALYLRVGRPYKQNAPQYPV